MKLSVCAMMPNNERDFDITEWCNGLMTERLATVTKISFNILRMTGNEGVPINKPDYLNTKNWSKAYFN